MKRQTIGQFLVKAGLQIRLLSTLNLDAASHRDGQQTQFRLKISQADVINQFPSGNDNLLK
jgi:hypothetical protein